MANTTIEKIVSQATANSAMTAIIAWQNYDNGAIQANFASLSASNGTIRLAASLDGSNWENLTTNASTMAAGASTKIFNVTDAGYGYVRVTWAAGSNGSGGRIDVYASRKARQ